ncbi:MAG: hypothetical protein K2Q01_01460 [Rickettsiales bacterium]|nr:hypothetical protein [Rickettsiales bacterium]
MSAYKIHRRIQLCGAALILAYGTGVFFSEDKPFPFFRWALYKDSAPVLSSFEIMITALQPGQKLPTPIPLTAASLAHRQDWLLTPYKSVQQLGQMILGRAPATEITRARRLVENFLRQYAYAEYDLVIRSTDTFDHIGSEQWATYRPVASFTKGQP